MPVTITTKDLGTTIEKQIREQVDKELQEFDGWRVRVKGPGSQPICTIEVYGPDGQLRTGGLTWDSERTVRKIVEEATHMVRIASGEKAL